MDLKDRPIQLLNFGAFLGFTGACVVFFYIQVFTGLVEATPSNDSIGKLYLIAILNASGLLILFFRVPLY